MSAKRLPEGWWQPHRGTLIAKDEVPTLFVREEFTSLTIVEHPECVTIEFGQETDQPPTVGQLVLSHVACRRLFSAMARQLLHHSNRALREHLAQLQRDGAFHRSTTAFREEDK